MPGMNHYLEAWELTDPQPLAQTVTSQVYGVTLQRERVVLKLLTPIGIDSEQSGAIALSYWKGRGAGKLIRHDSGAHLMEYVEGGDLTALVLQGQDEEATAIIAEVLDRLHADPVTPFPDGLIPLGTHFRSLFRRAEEAPESIFGRGARFAEKLLAHQRDVRVLHGDIHHWNIRHHARRGWLAFDPKGLVGDRAFDTANTLCNPDTRPDLVTDEERLLRNAEILARGTGIELARVLAYTYAYGCLSASWFLDAGDDARASQPLRVAEIVEPHVPQV